MGLIIGVSIGGFILTIIIPIVICAIIWCCVAQAAAGRTTRTVVATTPPYRTTVAAVSTTQQLATPVTYPIQGGYPAQVYIILCIYYTMNSLHNEFFTTHAMQEGCLFSIFDLFCII